ncbi:MAG: hypothetical protein AAGL68_03600 [Pseudomonadota bacterium]
MMDNADIPSKELVPVEDEPRGELTRGHTGKAKVVGPSTNPATNLLIADIVLRGASSLFRKKVEQGIVKTSDNEGQAREILDGRSIMTTLALYGASKLATRSVPGLAIVAGGLLAKTLYDRGKSIELSKRVKSKEQEPEA